MKNIVIRKVIKWFVILLVIAGVGTGGYFIYRNFAVAANARNTVQETTVQVAKGDLDVTISGTGTIEPIARYDIVPLVKGNILKAPFEEGAQVKAGDLLYQIDESDLSYEIQRVQNSIDKLNMNNQNSLDNIKNLEVYAPAEGKLSNFTLKEGEQVGANGKIGDIINDKQLIASVPFNKTQLQKIQVGQKAQLVLDAYMLYLDGTVSRVSSTPNATEEGALLYNVEISIDNPGAVLVGTEVNAIIKSPDGDIASPATGAVEYVKEQPVLSETSGKVKTIHVKNNEWVKAGQKILTLENEDLYDTIDQNNLSMKDLQLSLDAQLKKLDDYNILSPIDGTVIKKEYKAGDTIDNSNSNVVLMTVADMSKMIFTISVDELDIAKVSTGQKVIVTVDALPGTDFEGEVTNLSVEGTAQNGVTTYPVEVTISSPGKLRPGMNVNAKIQVESKKNVLYLPIAAVTKVGNKAFVFVKGDETGNAANNGSSQQNTGRKNTDSTQTQPAQGRGGGTGSANNSQASASRVGRRQAGSSNQSGMAGRQRREVTIGINNDDYIEIVSGLNEGDTVYLPVQASNKSNNGNTGFPGPGMIGGGAVRVPMGGGNR